MNTSEIVSVAISGGAVAIAATAGLAARHLARKGYSLAVSLKVAPPPAPKDGTAEAASAVKSIRGAA